ncbi:MAG: hypothetical protein M3R51_07485 [Candidatus Eremiobacteraeota bacterium]|nr:hypothetical protein [Candidatus Eremiobacteraeota bacterium]
MRYDRSPQKKKLFWHFGGYLDEFPVLELRCHAQTRKRETTVNAVLRELTAVPFVAIALNESLVDPSLDRIGAAVDSFRKLAY